MADLGEVAVEQSEVLSTEEVANIVEGVEPEEAILPSDKQEFEVPDKFKDKSLEDVIKSYQELEKMKGGDEISQEEKVVEESAIEESPPEPTEVEAEQYQKYADSLDKNGELSADEYAELAKAGYDKPTVDAEIKNRAERAEFETYKADKTLNDVLEPLGGGKDKFKAVSDWAATEKSEGDLKAFNQELANAGPLAKQALLKGLYSEYEAAGNQMDTVLHTSTPQTQANKGYKTQEEFFKDVGSEEYQNNPAYRAAVEKKMSLSDLF